jgi:hypothetical protein
MLVEAVARGFGAWPRPSAGRHPPGVSYFLGTVVIVHTYMASLSKRIINTECERKESPRADGRAQQFS